MVGRSRSGNNLHLAWARCRATVPGSQPAPKSFLISSICVRGWCCGGSCSNAISAVANASVTTHSSWPVIPFLGISPLPHDPALKHITIQSKEKPAGREPAGRGRSQRLPYLGRQIRDGLNAVTHHIILKRSRPPIVADQVVRPT